MAAHDTIVRVVVIGPASVGKTSLTIRVADDEFYEESKSTIGVDFKVKEYADAAGDGRGRIVMQLWDTAGQERFKCVVGAYYRGSDCVIGVYDITDRASLDKLRECFRDAQKHVDNPLVVLVGNKCDLDHSRQIATREAQQIADENGYEFMETSAKTNYNVSSMFEHIARTVHARKTTRALASDATRATAGSPPAGTAIVHPDVVVPRVHANSNSNSKSKSNNNNNKTSYWCCSGAPAQSALHAYDDRTPNLATT